LKQGEERDLLQKLKKFNLGSGHKEMLTESNTYTFTTTDDCSHDNYTFRKVTVNFYLFELTMLFKVCHKCHKLLKDHKKWKIKIN